MPREEERPPALPAPRALVERQAAVLAFITGRDAKSDDGGADAIAFVVGDARAGAEARLAVYAHMYRARIVEALESQFPRLARLLGGEGFAELAAAYVASEPSRHPSL